MNNHQLRHVLHADAEGNLACLTWSSSQQLVLLESHGEVLMLDATYKVNNIRLPLFTLAVVDKNGHGQPVAHALLAREDEAHIQLFLRDVLAWNNRVENAVFCTDKDLAEINAVISVCPSAHLLLCRFHIMKAFTEELNKHPCSDGDAVLDVSMMHSYVYGCAYEMKLCIECMEIIFVIIMLLVITAQYDIKCPVRAPGP